MASRFDVFLSHASSDKPLVEELARRLERENIRPWLDKWNLKAGAEWMPEIELALRDCASCAVIIGAGNTLGPWQNEEVRVAIDRRVSNRGCSFPVIPVLLPGFERPERSHLPSFLSQRTWVEFRRTLDDSEALRQLICGIRGIEPGPGPGGASFEGQNPYKGLELFDVKDAPLFFGREATTEWLLDSLKRKATGVENRFLAILGASGSGKSSLARAGLLAALKNGKLDGSASWLRAISRPGGEQPFVGLAKAMALLAPEKICGVVYDRLMRREDGCKSLHFATELVLDESARDGRVVVLVDQFEEIFTLCNDEGVRREFIDNLLHAGTVACGRTIVVLALRADFYHRCAAHDGLAAALSDHQLLVSPMSEDDLRRAIERPARLAGLEPEQGLIELLAEEIRGQPGALPLLQFALQELWRRREDHRMTIHAYREIGGIEGALRRKADAVYACFTPQQQELCKRIFLRLVHLGEGAEDTRRRAQIREVVPDDPAQAALVRSIIGRLTDETSRLLTTESRDPAAGEGTLEVAHEALIRSWPELRKWIEADRSSLRTHRQLTDAAQQWQEHTNDSAYLYSGSRLDVAHEWAKNHRGDLNALERRFLARSLGARRRHEAEERAHARMIAEAVEARHRAEVQRAKDAEAANKLLREQLYDNHIAVAEREVTMNQDIGRADLLLQDCPEEFRGWEWLYLMRLRDGGRAPLKGHRSALWGAEFSPDGKKIATVSVDGRLKIWDAATGRLRPHGDINAGEILELSPYLKIPILGPLLARRLARSGKILPITCLDFNADGRRIATGSFAPPLKARLRNEDLRLSPGLIRVWDVETGQMVAWFQDAEQLGVVLSLAYSPDGRWIASSSIDPRNNFVVRDAESGEILKVVSGHTSQIHRLRYSPDGRVLATSETNGIVKLWDTETFREIRTIPAHPAPVVGLAFEPPDGARFASAGQDGTLRVWETETGCNVLTLQGHTGAALDVRYSPDGKRIASGGFDKTVRVWDATTGKEKITLRGHDDTVWSVAFSPDGRRLVSGGFDKVAIVWDATSHQESKGPGLFTVAGRDDHRVNCVAFSADGRYLASGGWDQHVHLLDGESGELIRSFSGHKLVIWTVAFSPDGRRIASASWDHTVKLWDLETGAELFTFRGHTAPVHSLAFSPDGSRLVSGGFDGHMKVWDASTGKISAHCDGFIFPVLAVAFSPDGRYVASGGSERTVKLWDADRGKVLVALKGHEASVHGLAFSPDGSQLASAGWDRTMRIWDIRRKGTLAAIGRRRPVVRRHSDRVHGVAFSMDGRRIASACENKMVHLWDTNSVEEFTAPRHHRGVVFSVAFSPDGRRVAAGCWTNSSWVRTWDVE